MTGVILLPWVAIEVGHREEVSHFQVVKGRTLHVLIVEVILLSGGHLVVVSQIIQCLAVFFVG